MALWPALYFAPSLKIRSKIHILFFRESSDESGEAAAASGLGCVYQAMGQHSTALDYHLLDLEIGQRLGDKTAQIRASANIGETYEALGELEKAGSYHDQLLNIATLINDREAKIKAFSNLGKTDVN